MSEQVTTEIQTFEVGSTVFFKEYILQEGETIEPKFVHGEELVLIDIADLAVGKYVAARKSDSDVQDTVFWDEVNEEPMVIEPAVAKESTESEAPVDAGAPKAKKAKADKKAPKATKAKATPKKEVAAEPTTIAKEPKAKKARKSKVKSTVESTVESKEAAKKGKVKTKTETSQEKDSEVIDTQGVLDATEGKTYLEAAADLAEQAERTYFILGGILAHIYYEKEYLKISDEQGNKIYDVNKGFDAYVYEVLGLHYRKAMYLINIYMHFAKMGIGEESLQEIGWTKARELVGVATEDNLAELIDYASTHTLKEFTQWLAVTHKGKEDKGSGKQDGSYRKVILSIPTDRAEVYEEAIKQALTNDGIDSEGDALMLIVSDWLETAE
jgi:hypothetical protein